MGSRGVRDKMRIENLKNSEKIRGMKGGLWWISLNTKTPDACGKRLYKLRVVVTVGNKVGHA